MFLSARFLVFLVPTLQRGNALSAPVVGYAALERRGRHSHAGAWEREKKQLARPFQQTRKIKIMSA
jgi:hypothetical protein